MWTQVQEGWWIVRYAPSAACGLRRAHRRARGAVPPAARAECVHVGQVEPLHRRVRQGAQVGRHPLNSFPQTINCCCSLTLITANLIVLPELVVSL